MIKNSSNNISFLYAASLSPLDKNTERELVEKMAKGDKKARETLIRANLRFAIKQAAKNKQYNLPFEDLVSVAVTGLIKAVDLFNPSMPNRIITYANWQIRAEFKELYDKKQAAEKYAFSEVSCSEMVENYLSDKVDTESMSPEDYAINACFKESFYKNVKKIPAEERTIFLMHNGLCGYDKLSYTEIGKRYGKPKQWAWAKSQKAEQFMADQMADWAA
ncbi:MAG: sigma-70 family RNA polymerase sigma factor [Treponema sp.]|nr:sigma-70 family RNA polymerase sigma factor [Treponema sp.]